MGIRIHKILGYGLTDVIADESTWSLKNDSRFDKSGYMFDHEDVSFSIKGFIEYLENIIEAETDDENDRFDIRLLLASLDKTKETMYNKRLTGFYETIKYDMEFGDPKVLVVVPPSCIKEWSRYDDAIDYYDPVNMSADGGISPSVIHINRPLYPWESYINISSMPPERLTGTQSQSYNMLRNFGIDQMQDVDRVLNSIGVDSIEALGRDIIPSIPVEVVEMLKYLKIFVDESTIYQLHPVIYGYWG